MVNLLHFFSIAQIINYYKMCTDSSFWSSNCSILWMWKGKREGERQSSPYRYMELNAEGKKCLFVFVCATTNERLQTILIPHTNLFEFIYLCPFLIPFSSYYFLLCASLFFSLPIPARLSVCIIFAVKSSSMPFGVHFLHAFTKPSVKFVHT